MCGIFGAIWRRAPPNSVELVARASHALRYRGPDDTGVEAFREARADVVLGHTRLSIIDLSSGGHQPMFSADRRFCIVFNGEIYNYRKLRDELAEFGHVFRTSSDTEVLLVAWVQWGKACLVRLVGMFAFAVLDRLAGELTCARDAFGIKPFFYRSDPGSFAFASEVAAIKALRGGEAELDWQRAYDYLVHGDYDSGERTFFRNVRHLPPGRLVRVDLTTCQVSTPEMWWVPAIAECHPITFGDAVEQVREKMLDSIRLHLRSDVPLGAALSGGIDSSAVVCAIRHLEPDLPINTFSFIAAGSDVSEESWVDRINQHVGATGHKVTVKPDELCRDLDDMIVAQGEPFGSTSIYAQYRVFRLAKEHGVTVTLDGQGADEMLAGYNGYPGQRIGSLLDQGRFVEAVRFLDSWAGWPGRSKLAGLKRAAAEMMPGKLYDVVRRWSGMPDSPEWIRVGPLQECGVRLRFPRVRFAGNSKGRRVIAELAVSLTERGLPALLRHGDRNSMRFSVESRVPFLTLELVELLLSLPEEFLISREGQTKHVFRAAMRGIVPDDVLDRRDKIGFETPEKEWLLGMAETIRGWLCVDLRLPFFVQSEVLKEFDLIVAGKKPFSWQVWRWINFSRWHRHFLA